VTFAAVYLDPQVTLTL